MRIRTAPIAAALAAMAGLASCSAVEYSEAYEIADPVSQMVVDVDRGHLEIIGADVDTIQVERHIDGWEGNLDLETRVIDGVLYISARCSGVLRCDVDSVITVPHDLDIDATVDVGHITVSHLAGAADLSVNEGTLVGYQLSPLEGNVTVGVGTIELDLLEDAPLSVAIGDGTVHLAGETDSVDVLGS